MTVGPFDLIIIGSGPLGLCSAKTYLQVHPSARVVILDANETVGGTWSRERLYPNLKTNNLLGTFVFPDYPWDEAEYGVKKGEHIPGSVIHRYLLAYAKHFDVHKLIRFSTVVKKLEKLPEGGWKVIVTPASDGTDDVIAKEYETKRIIVASGLTSQAFIPTYEGASTFGGDIIHVKDFAKHQDTIGKSKNVVVIGGAKSAYDAVYAYASAGVSVDWIIRPSGRGPVWMAPTHITPFKIWIELLVGVRLVTWLVPCTWDEADGYGWIRWFLHATSFGRMIVRGMAGIMDGNLLDLVGYEKHPETAKLKPKFSSLAVGTNLSILNYPTDVFEYVRNGKVRVRRADIERLSPATVHLTTGETINADVLFCATGWKYVPPFLEGLERELDLPRTDDKIDPLTEKADMEILSRYPALKNQTFPPRPLPEPASGMKKAKMPSQIKSYRLHRFMVPPAYYEDRSIAFVGVCLSLRGTVQAQLQALWITSYFDNLLKNQPASQEQLEWEATLHAQSVKWTTPGGSSTRIPDLVFNSLPYYSLLMKDLGLRPWRKGNAIKELLSSHMPSDYSTVVEEWLQANANAGLNSG